MIQAQRTKVGVIGLGSIGLRHAKNLVSMGHDVYAFDPSEERCKIFIQDGGRTVPDKSTIAEICHAVIIASPSSMHLDDLAWAIENNMHAFVEKPLAHTMSGLKELERLAAQRNLVISLGMNMRFNPAVRKVNEILNREELGVILWANYWHSSFLPDWRPDVDYKRGYAADPKTGGVIFDVIHGFDLLFHLLGEYTVKAAVTQSSSILDIPSDVCADVQCLHASGMTSTLHMDFITRPKTHTFTIAGAKALARIDIPKRQLSIFGINGDLIQNYIFAETQVNADYCEELNDFISAIYGAKLRGCSLRDGMSVLSNVVDSRMLAGLPSA